VLKVGDLISVWWLNRTVMPAIVVREPSPTIFSYSLRLSSGMVGATGVDNLNSEGRWWARGHEGPAVNALQTIAVLRSA
jgi:hypothetical protein